MFRDHRTIGEWLPKTMYVTRFQSSSFRPLATFEEDIDVTTATAHGVKLEGDSLGTWREELLDLRSRNRPNTSSSQQSNALRLGWNNRIAGEDDTVGTPASYTISLPDGLAANWGLTSSSRLDLMLAAVEGSPGPRAPDGEEEEDAAEGAEPATDPPSGSDSEDEETDRSIGRDHRRPGELGPSGPVRLWTDSETAQDGGAPSK